jgi:hypothetical protein
VNSRTPRLAQTRLILAALLAFVPGSAVEPQWLALTRLAAQSGPVAPSGADQAPAVGRSTGAAATEAAQSYVEARRLADLDVVRVFRPAYPFWQHIFTIPDGRIIFGSARDGRLVATFPAKGDWLSDGIWEDPTLAATLAGQQLPVKLNDRRDEVVRLLEPTTGPLLHNPTRGLFLLPNVPRYGPFLSEWGLIYERFGVPAEIGLAQAILESGLDGTARSRANALGLCQWLSRNWRYLNTLSPAVIEAYNQTTQAPYCAAYLSILATMYGSFIPALSEHHAGGVNVGRAVINGERLGGTTTREQYLMGSQFARDLRNVSVQRYRDLYRTYGVRSFLYAEMVFGNTINVERLKNEVPQTRIFAMRSPRPVPATEITSRSGLSSEEVRRYNPALTRQVPAQANIYLPMYVPAFGPDVSFWHRPPSAAYAAVLNDFVRLDAGVARWHEASFEPVLQGFRGRFEGTGTEEGTVMATTLTYVMNDLRTSRRAAILEDFRTNGHILDLFTLGVAELKAAVAGRP